MSTEQLGGWPERTPLNAQTVGRREFDDYRMQITPWELDKYLEAL